jgi:hypothetical protein
VTSLKKTGGERMIESKKERRRKKDRDETMAEETRGIKMEKGQKDRQCTYNVTLRCIRETVVAVQKQYMPHILIVYL